MAILDLTKKSLRARIGKFGKTVAAMRTEGQAILILIYLRAAKHGDYSLANLLIDESEGLNRNMIVNHMRTYAGLKTLADYPEEEREALRADNAGKTIIGWSGKQFIKDNLDQAKANPWWAKAKQEKEFLGVDADEILNQALNRIDKARVKGIDLREQGDEEHADLVKLGVKRTTIERLMNLLPVGEVVTEIVHERDQAA